MRKLKRSRMSRRNLTRLSQPNRIKEWQVWAIFRSPKFQELFRESGKPIF